MLRAKYLQTIGTRAFLDTPTPASDSHFNFARPDPARTHEVGPSAAMMRTYHGEWKREFPRWVNQFVCWRSTK
jgi:hypothetical protein